MKWIRVKRCFWCGKFMGFTWDEKHTGDYMCGECWDECKRREDAVRENMKKVSGQ